jgi:hypothetical protein
MARHNDSETDRHAGHVVTVHRLRGRDERIRIFRVEAARPLGFRENSWIVLIDHRMMAHSVTDVTLSPRDDTARR